jgi:hypothetical protein
MTSISTPDAASDTVTTDVTATDVATVNSWLDQLKLIGIELRDSDGQPVVVTDENVDEVASAVKAVTASQFGSSTESDDNTGDNTGDDEILPPFELPDTYRDAAGRESLSETKAFADHLNEHWGF